MLPLLPTFLGYIYMETNIHQSVKKEDIQMFYNRKLLLWEKRECRITKFYSILENDLCQFSYYLFWRKSCAWPTDLWYNFDCWGFSTRKVEQMTTKLNDQVDKGSTKNKYKTYIQMKFQTIKAKIKIESRTNTYVC